MKYLSITTAAVLLTGLTVFSTSCSKDKDEPAPVCRISSINISSPNDNSSAAFTYDNDGRISTATSSSGSSTTYTYSGNTINVTSKGADGVTQYSYIVLLDSRKHITSLTAKDAQGVTTLTSLLEYDAQGHLTKFTEQPPGGAISSATTQFSNGDLVSVTRSNNTTTTYSYYTDKSFMDGDFLKLIQIFAYGALYAENAHLIKSETSGNSIKNYNYEFDASGKITKATITSGGTVETYTYAYLCQ